MYISSPQLKQVFKSTHIVNAIPCKIERQQVQLISKRNRENYS